MLRVKISLLFLIIFGLNFLSGLEAFRDLPSYYIPGGTFDVTIQINTDLQNLPTGVIISETLPPNWSIISANPDYLKFSPSTNTYKWVQFNQSGVLPFTITYTVSVPEDATGEYEFSGIIKTSSDEQQIEGDTVIEEGGSGDINNDGNVDISDVLLCLRIAINQDVSINGETYSPPYPFWLVDLADIDRSGDVDISDVIIILRISIGLN